MSTSSSLFRTPPRREHETLFVEFSVQYSSFCSVNLLTVHIATICSVVLTFWERLGHGSWAIALVMHLMIEKPNLTLPNLQCCHLFDVLRMHGRAPHQCHFTDCCHSTPMLHQICNDAIVQLNCMLSAAVDTELSILGRYHGSLLTCPHKCMASCMVSALVSILELSLTLTLLQYQTSGPKTGRNNEIEMPCAS